MRINDNYVAARLYLNNEDVNTFPNRLIFSTTAAKAQELLTELAPTAEETWINEEIAALGETPKIIVPFILRTQEEAHTSFKARRQRGREFDFACGAPVLVLGGNVVPSLCHGCPRSIELRGARCPDYVEGNLTCLKTGMLTLERRAFLLNEKGELEYVTSDEATGAESVEDTTNTESTGN